MSTAIEILYRRQMGYPTLREWCRIYSDILVDMTRVQAREVMIEFAAANAADEIRAMANRARAQIGK